VIRSAGILEKRESLTWAGGRGELLRKFNSGADGRQLRLNILGKKRLGLVGDFSRRKKRRKGGVHYLPGGKGVRDRRDWDVRRVSAPLRTTI